MSRADSAADCSSVDGSASDTVDFERFFFLSFLLFLIGMAHSSSASGSGTASVILIGSVSPASRSASATAAVLGTSGSSSDVMTSCGIAAASLSAIAISR